MMYSHSADSGTASFCTSTTETCSGATCPHCHGTGYVQDAVPAREFERAVFVVEHMPSAEDLWPTRRRWQPPPECPKALRPLERKGLNRILAWSMRVFQGGQR